MKYFFLFITVLFSFSLFAPKNDSVKSEFIVKKKKKVNAGGKSKKKLFNQHVECVKNINELIKELVDVQRDSFYQMESCIGGNDQFPKKKIDCEEMERKMQIFNDEVCCLSNQCRKYLK